MQYFVTGGTCFIGAYVVRDLLREGHDVTIYDVAPNLEFLEDILGDAISDVTVVRGDVTDMPHLLRAMQQAGPQRVVHLASLLSLTSEENPLRAVQVNLEGTIHTFEAALAVGAEKVVWASSIAAPGRGGTEPGDVIRNDALHAPIGLYGASKSFLERLAVTYERDRGLNAVGLRFTFVYGYGKAHTVERGSGVVYLDELIDKPALGQPSVVPNGEDVQDSLLRRGRRVRGRARQPDRRDALGGAHRPRHRGSRRRRRHDRARPAAGRGDRGPQRRRASQLHRLRPRRHRAGDRLPPAGHARRRPAAHHQRAPREARPAPRGRSPDLASDIVRAGRRSGFPANMRRARDPRRSFTAHPDRRSDAAMADAQPGDRRPPTAERGRTSFIAPERKPSRSSVT